VKPQTDAERRPRTPKEPVRVRLYVCTICGKSGGTLIKVKQDKGQTWYAHRECLSGVANGRANSQEAESTS